MKKKEALKIALVGNPNSGKSSVFNHLTGLLQKTGNFPGVTVERRTGMSKMPNGDPIRITDLPGTYSLFPNSLDERLILKVLLHEKDEEYPDLIVCVADITHLERHLLLCSQIIDLGIPVVLAVTMSDLAQSQGISCDVIRLTKSLQIPVVMINGRSGEGVSDLKKTIELELSIRKQNSFLHEYVFPEKAVKRAKAILDTDNDYRAMLHLHHFRILDQMDEKMKSQLNRIVEEEDFKSIPLQVEETLKRFDQIVPLVRKVIFELGDNKRETITEKLDKVLTHKFWGTLIFAVILFLVFQAIFAWAIYPMDLIDMLFASLSHFLKVSLPAGFLNDLLTDGLIPGLGGIMIFIPQITILFILISFLEDIGYMSRAVYLSDSLMRKFGLNGRSVVTLFSGLACAVPAIMATRTISNWKERLSTILVTPLISCSARIPVFTILVSFAVPRETYLGIFNLQGLVMMGLYVLGAVAALIAAFIINKLIKTGESGILLMELPSYKIPYWKGILFNMLDKVKVFVWEAGKIILIISMVLWLLSTNGPREKMELADNLELVKAQNPDLSEADYDDIIASRKLEASYIGSLGKFIEPVIRPLGFDWKIGIALLTSFAAREVFVGTIATIYSVGSQDDQETIREKMAKEVDPVTGLPVFRPAVAFSLLIFYVFAMQCASTLAIVKRETNSWKWPIIQFVYMTILAWTGSWITFQILN